MTRKCLGVDLRFESDGVLKSVKLEKMSFEVLWRNDDDDDDDDDVEKYIVIFVVNEPRYQVHQKLSFHDSKSVGADQSWSWVTFSKLNPKFLDRTQPTSLHPTQPNPSSTLGMAY